MYKRIERFINNLLKFNIKGKYIDKLTYNVIYLLIFLLTIPPLFSIVFTTYDLLGSDYYILLIYLPILLYVFIYNLKNRRVKFSWDFIFLTIFIIISFISCFTSVNFFKAFTGIYLRRYGFLTLFIIYLVYVNTKVIINKKIFINIINLLLFIGIMNSIFCIDQSLGNNFVIYDKFWANMAFGLCTNPNMCGSLMMMLTTLGLCMIIFFDSKNKYYIISTILCFIGLVLASSTGPFLAFCLVLIILLIYNSIKKMHKNSLLTIWIAIFVSLYAIFNYGNIFINEHYYNIPVSEAGTISGDINILTQEVVNKVSNLIIGKDVLYISEIKDDKIGSGRIAVWKETIKYIGRDNHIWLGSGPDSLSILYNGKIENETSLSLDRIDKAHNAYLNILATTGIFSFIAYIGWTIVLHKKGILSSNPYIIVLFITFVGYNLQSLLNIDVIEVAPYYYIICAMMMGMENNNAKNSMQKCK